MPDDTAEGPVIHVDDVTFLYPGSGVPALRDFSVDIGRGEVVGVIGQNGSGKTTFTKLLNGLLKPSIGTVAVNGVLTRDRRVQELARHVGYVFQNPNHQLFSRTVRDELAFGPTNLGLDAEEVEKRVKEAIEFFDLQAVLEQHPYRLSFPLRKLVGIASVYTMQPQVFILDEPSTGQDHKTVGIINDVIGQLRDFGSTVLCVSHDMPLLADVVDRVLVLGGGVLLADATPAEVFSNAALMSSTNLKAPQATELGIRVTAPRGHPVPLSPADVARQVAALSRTVPTDCTSQTSSRNG